MEKVEGPNYQALKKQLLEELRDEILSTGEMRKKIEQLRRNIECISRLMSCTTIETREVSGIEAIRRTSEYLLYYVEKLKEETEKMLKE